MPVIDRIQSYHDGLTRIRRDIHRHPELGYNEMRTSELVARELDIRFEPQRGPDGDIDGFLALAQDTSWREHSRQQLASLFDAAP